MSAGAVPLPCDAGVIRSRGAEPGHTAADGAWVLAAISASFPPDRRGRAIGTWSGVSAIAAAG